ncbi:MAG: hypothetical protein U1F65_08630 [Verrucomicrobiota bacterium]
MRNLRACTALILWLATWPAFSQATKNPGMVFSPGSLGYLVWTNFIAQTNSREMQMWREYSLPTNFPSSFVNGDQLPAITRPELAWNPRSLVHGLKGQTAISQCWTAQGGHGQVPVTALTRRHGYTRGHSMGPGGITAHFSGQRVYFCTTNNDVVEMVVQSALVQAGKGFDYTILFFARDLPPAIDPIRVADLTPVFEKMPPAAIGQLVVYQTEQGGNVSAGFPPFVNNTWKSGDSGSPNLLPLPGELVFFSGRSTSAPSPRMQSDMDVLTLRAKLDPRRYQMEWLDVSRFSSN